MPYPKKAPKLTPEGDELAGGKEVVQQVGAPSATGGAPEIINRPRVISKTGEPPITGFGRHRGRMVFDDPAEPSGGVTVPGDQNAGMPFRSTRPWFSVDPKKITPPERVVDYPRSEHTPDAVKEKFGPMIEKLSELLWQKANTMQGADQHPFYKQVLADPLGAATSVAASLMERMQPTGKPRLFSDTPMDPMNVATDGTVLWLQWLKRTRQRQGE